jgi:hypothetical protein
MYFQKVLLGQILFVNIQITDSQKVDIQIVETKMSTSKL